MAMLTRPERSRGSARTVEFRLRQPPNTEVPAVIPAEPATPPPPAPTVVGIGADGWAGLPESSRAVLLDAQVVIGGARQLDLLPPVLYGTPCALAFSAAARRGRSACRTRGAPDQPYWPAATPCSTASGARSARSWVPGTSVSCRIRPPSPTPAPGSAGRWRTPRSSRSWADPPTRLAAALHEGRRLLVLSAGAGTPGEVAALLRERGFGPSPMRVLEQLGGEAEDCADGHGRRLGASGRAIR